MLLSRRFDAHLERAYQADLHPEKIRFARLIGCLTVAFNAVFLVLDQFAFQHAEASVLPLRMLIFLFAGTLVALTYQPSFVKNYAVSVSCALGMVGLCIVGMIGVASHRDIAADTYYVGLIMVIVTMHTLTFVPLVATVFITLLLTTCYLSLEISKPNFVEADQQILVLTNIVFLVSIGVISVVGQVLRDAYSRDNYVLRHSLQRDVELEEEKHRLASYLAEHDVLTGLPNRLRFERLGQSLVEQANSDGGAVAVFFVDLDNFKPVNDQHGHAAGDRVLKKVAERLTLAAGAEAVAARIGGDEFVVCMGVGRNDVPSSGFTAARLASAIQRGIEVRGHQVHLTASIGVAAYPYDGDELDEVVEVADAQMYRAKKVRGEIQLSPGIEAQIPRSAAGLQLQMGAFSTPVTEG